MPIGVLPRRGKGERAQNLELFPIRYKAPVFKYGEPKKKIFKTRSVII
jgi:hypothetical protein